MYKVGFKVLFPFLKFDMIVNTGNYLYIDFFPKWEVISIS